MRGWLRTGGVFLLIGTLVLVGRSWSITRPPAPRTRIGVVNLTYVIKNYEKYHAFQEEIKKAIQPYQQRDADKRTLVEGLTKKAAVPTTSADGRTALERRIRRLQREIEDNKDEAKAYLDKRSNEHLQVLYADVQAAAQHYARAHDIELVLSYNDASTEAEQNSPEVILRKMQGSACFPLYAAGGIDISKEVLAALNHNLKHQKDR